MHKRISETPPCSTGKKPPKPQKTKKQTILRFQTSSPGLSPFCHVSEFIVQSLYRESQSAQALLPESSHREDIHKVDIMTFCQQKATQCLKSETPGSRDSALLWQLLVLLCRQNGVSHCFDIGGRWKLG